ncbi:ABC transporter permease [Chryseobacterium sp. KLBC 52]|uniref:ABC transporter permease n=1 Tax=Chryseobacterium sp. KLBC 52 TaxID=1862702 RepID=UPI000E0B07A2|nr:ABC transporter permease [Chryseobacterium sp. KLBC 52]
MKINNKKRVSYHVGVQLVVLALLLLSISVLRYLGYTYFIGIFFLTAFLVLVYGFLKNQFIFEYENSGQVISIKSYRWISSGKKFPVFEMPQKKIVRIEIQERTFRKYLIILFSNSSGKVLRRNIDITFCSEDEIQLLFEDIANNLVKEKSGTYFL